MDPVATTHVITMHIKDLIILIAAIAGSVSAFLSVVTFFVTRQNTIQKLKSGFILVKDCEMCKKSMEKHEKERNDELKDISKQLKNGENEFKTIRLALSELFAASGIPREKLDQIRTDVFVNNK